MTTAKDQNHDDPCARFPDTSWRNEFRDLSREPTPLLPPGWRDRLLQIGIRTAPGNGADECAAVREQIELREPAMQAIQDEARSYEDNLWPVLHVIMDDPNRWIPGTKDLICTYLIPHVRTAVFWMKEEFMRGRPEHCCGEGLKLVFPPASPYYPGHPSYPAGHSAFAYALAYVLEQMFPQKMPDLRAAAATVGLHRVMAGAHFPSDIEAGRLLAREIVDLLMQNQTFINAVRTARQDWP